MAVGRHFGFLLTSIARNDSENVIFDPKLLRVVSLNMFHITVLLKLIILCISLFSQWSAAAILDFSKSLIVTTLEEIYPWT